MYVPRFTRHRRDKDVRKELRKRHDGKDGKDDKDDDDDDDDKDVDHQQQEHRTCCFGKCSSLTLLLSVLFAVVIVGSAFFLSNALPTSGNMLRSGGNVRPTMVGATITSTDNKKNNKENLSITATAEEFVVFIKDIYPKFLQTFDFSSKVVNGSVHEYEHEFDGFYADSNYKKDRMLGRKEGKESEGGPCENSDSFQFTGNSSRTCDSYFAIKTEQEM